MEDKTDRNQRCSRITPSHGKENCRHPTPCMDRLQEANAFHSKSSFLSVADPLHRSSPLLQGHAASGSLVLKNEYCCCKIKALVALHLPLPQGSRAPRRTFPTTHLKPIKSYAKSTHSLHSYLEVYYLLHLRYLFRFHAVS